MLFLLFQAGEKNYAVEAKRVHEIVPCVRLLNHPGAPPYVAGLFNYRGCVVPVVDFNLLVDCPPCRPRLSTRILLISRTGSQRGKQRLLGLMVETLIETLEKNHQDFSQPGLAAATTPFLGNIHCDGKRLIQWVTLEHLLPAEAQPLLFPAAHSED